jgi:PAS domain S-box-containing protein
MTRILILDDRPINRQFLSTLLGYKKFETREAANGLEGLQIAEEWDPELAIVDIRMPVMDGIEFVQRVHADPKLASMALIYYTASYDAADALRIGRESGVAHVLMKPSEPDLILETIDLALGRTSAGPPAAPPTAEETEFDRLQSGAMRIGALIDFQLEIAAQHRPENILRILARAAPTVIASEVGAVSVSEDKQVSGFISDRGVMSPFRPELLDRWREVPSLSVPLETATKKYGSLELIGRQGKGVYTLDDKRIALTIAAQAVVAYENLRLIEQIRRDVNLLRATIEASSDGIAVVDSNSRLIAFNQQLVDIWGLPDDVRESGDANGILQNSLKLIKDPTAFPRAVERVRGGEEVSETHELIDGRYIECHGTPRAFESDATGRVWSFRDVTARMQAAAALRESEAQFRSLIANIPDVTWRADALGTVHFVSSNIERMYGFTAEEVCAPGGRRVWLQRIHPADVTRVAAAYTALFERREELDIEYRRQRKDGTWFWMHDRSLGTYERDGVTYADGIYRDITARKEAEAEIKRSARERELLLNSTAEGIFAVDMNQRCTMVNRVAAALFGRTIDDLVGTPIHDLVHHHKADGNPHPAAECRILTTLQTGTQVRFTDEIFWRVDGTSFPIEGVAAPLIDQGTIRGAVVTFSDVTDRRQLERRVEQVNRIDSLGRMAATIAHEFNNVLMGIQPFAEVIRRKVKGDPALQKAADHILNSVARGKGVTRDILRVSNASEPQMKSVELLPWLELLIPEIDVLVGARVQVDLDVPRYDFIHVRCDPAQMQQVLTNLAVNARDAMGGSGALRIGAERAGGMVRIDVVDTGCGIPPETLPYIFEPLFTTKHSGTGLGLAVAQQIVVRNGGTIAVESTVGEGTRFVIELPEAAPETRPDDERPADQQLGIRCVVIVEDEPSVASGLEAILEAEGVEVHVVERGAEAQGAVARFGPDAVVLDMSLPDMSGADVYEQIAARWPDMAVIFSTGHADESRLPQKSSKHVAFLRKPYSSDVLLSKLREVI